MVSFGLVWSIEFDDVLTHHSQLHNVLTCQLRTFFLGGGWHDKMPTFLTKLGSSLQDWACFCKWPCHEEPEAVQAPNLCMWFFMKTHSSHAFIMPCVLWLCHQSISNNGDIIPVVCSKLSALDADAYYPSLGGVHMIQGCIEKFIWICIVPIGASHVMPPHAQNTTINQIMTWTLIRHQFQVNHYFKTFS